MTPAEAKRHALVETLTDHVLNHGLGGASLRPLAVAASTSDRMLLYYFKDKRELIAAILARVCARFAETLATAELTPARPAGTLARELPELATRMPLWRFMQIRFEIVALATRGDAACAHAAESLTRALFAWIARGIAGDPARRPSEAALLLQLLEGSMMLKASGSEDLRTLTMRPAAG